MIAFLIPQKMFLKIESLMCALKAHINRTHKFIYYQKGRVPLKIHLNLTVCLIGMKNKKIENGMDKSFPS